MAKAFQHAKKAAPHKPGRLRFVHFAFKPERSKMKLITLLEETMRRMLVRSGAVLLVLVLAAGPASAEDKPVELKLWHWVPPTHPLHKTIEDWGADVEKASGGTIKYKVFPAQQ